MQQPFFGTYLVAALLAVSFPAIAAQPEHQENQSQAHPPSLPDLIPAPDETAVGGDGNDETDALLDCYAAFKGSPGITDVGPPHITLSPSLGYVLRADFFLARDTTMSLHRTVCLERGGGVTTNETPYPFLDPPGTKTPDDATQKLIDKWAALRKAEETREASMTYAAADAATVRALEGIWRVGKVPDARPCTAQNDLGTQIEFEFRKSGGRVQVYELPDLFTEIALSGFATSNDIMIVRARTRDGGMQKLLRIRLPISNRVAFLGVHPKRDPATEAPADFAYRCGDADLSVNAGVSAEKLAAFMPPVTGGWVYPVVNPAMPDKDMCRGKAEVLLNGKRFAASPQSMQIELYGPVHFWVFADRLSREHPFAYDHVLSVQDGGEHVLKLRMQEDLWKDGAWDSKASRGKLYQLTLVDRGNNRIEVPELGKTFVRCGTTDPVTIGMHRW